MVVVVVGNNTGRWLPPVLVVVVVAVVDGTLPVRVTVNLVAEVVVVAAHAGVVVDSALSIDHPLGHGVIVAGPVVRGRENHIVSVGVACV